MTLPEAWEIDYLERSRRVQEALEREFLEIPIGPRHRPDKEEVQSSYEIERERQKRDAG